MAGDALTFRVAFVVRWLLWVVRFVVIWPLATMALMALFVLWKDNTTPGKLLVKEINFVRQTAPAGQFPVSECWFSSSDSSGRSEIQDIDQSAERVRDQLSVMASPNGNLDEVHEGLLLQAVRASWLAKENRARIDDVVDFLKNASDSEQYAGSPTIRSRLDEMIVLLDQYTANGTYGQYFNSDEPSLRDDAKMVVLELGGLEDRPSLLVAVMFSLIIYIENRMYRTPRNLKNPLNELINGGIRIFRLKRRMRREKKLREGGNNASH